MPKLEPPQIVATSVRVAEVRLPDIRLAVEVVVRNPNARALAVEALTATLVLGGAEVGQAKLAQPATLPAQGEARLPLDVRGDASIALGRIAQAFGAARALDYEVRGSLTMADGTTLPFRRVGRVPEDKRT